MNIKCIVAALIVPMGTPCWGAAYKIKSEATIIANANLLYAAKNGRLNMVIQALGEGAEVDAVDKDGKTALELATNALGSFMWTFNYGAVIDCLVEAGANINGERHQCVLLRSLAIAIDNKNRRVVRHFMGKDVNISGLSSDREAKLEEWGLHPTSDVCGKQCVEIIKTIDNISFNRVFFYALLICWSIMLKRLLV